MTPRLASTFRLTTALALAAVAAPARGVAQTTSAPAASGLAAAASPAANATPRASSAITPTTSLDAFRVITERNIFNPMRSARATRSTEEPAARVDTLAFVGTLDYEQGNFAIFDGSDAAWRKAFRVGQTVAQFTVKRITADTVELERDGRALALKIGQQLRRPEGGDWNVSAADLARAEAPATRPDAPTRPSDATTTPAAPGGTSDTLRRLMEQRQKQLKQ